MTFRDKVKALKIKPGSFIKRKRAPGAFEKVTKIDYINKQVVDTTGNWGLGLPISVYLVVNSSLEKRLYDVC